MESKLIRIVLADDHSLMREGTRRILEQYPDLRIVGEAGDGEQALSLVQQLKPDVAILDIRMPKINGIDLVRLLRQCCPETKTLMLTAYDDDDYVLALMEAGASGYLLKTAHPGELVESVRGVYSGEPVLHPAIAAKVARLWAHRRVASETGTVEQLSPRELEVLALAAKGLRNKAIADSLYISVRTVEGHLNSIFTKLGVSSRLEAVLYAVSRHLVALEEDERK
jgi:DNA-binding NarL/FixJ family response regulator